MAASSPPQPLAAWPGGGKSRGVSRGVPAMLCRAVPPATVPHRPPPEGSALPPHHPVPSCPPRAQPGGSSPPSCSLRRRLHHAAILWPRRIYLAPPQRGEARRGEASPPAQSRSLAGLPPSAQQSQLSTASPGSLTVAVSGGVFARYWVWPGLSPKNQLLSCCGADPQARGCRQDPPGSGRNAGRLQPSSHPTAR